MYLYLKGVKGDSLACICKTWYKQDVFVSNKFKYPAKIQKYHTIMIFLNNLEDLH